MNMILKNKIKFNKSNFIDLIIENLSTIDEHAHNHIKMSLTL
jgi:hypothetical protein